MEEGAILELIERLSSEGRVFHYFKDRYALMLLSWFVKDGRTVRDVKSSRFRGLLEKPVVKSVTKARRDGVITREALQQRNAAESAGYRITYDIWGDPHDGSLQTSRPGMNLVLQVNFPVEHDLAYQWLLEVGEQQPFVVHGHPARAGRYNTMGWARIDIDLDAGEALIEEIQNDWIRNAQEMAYDAKAAIDNGHDHASIWCNDGLFQCQARQFMTYADEVLSAYEDVWAEAVLAAAIEFLIGDLGIRRIFYHTLAGGNRLKGMDGPPQSLYTTLPRKFCFQEVEESPLFLEKPITPSAAAVRVEGGKAGRMAGRAIEEPEPEENHPPVRFHLLEL